MSHQRWVGCHLPFLCSTTSLSPSACLPGAAHGTRTTASQPHGKMFGVFSWLFLTQIGSLISFSMWPWWGGLGRNSCAKTNSARWEQVAEGQNCWATIVPRSRRTAPGAVLPPWHVHRCKCLWVPRGTACKPGATALSRWRLVQKDGRSLSI